MKQKLADTKQNMLRHKHLRSKLNEQALHFEILLNKMNPEILKERMTLIREDDK
jgi:hypothetical protein